MTEQTTTHPTKVTVNLIPEAYAVLEKAWGRPGDNGTETINRALQLYAAVCDAPEGTALTFDYRPGDERTVAVLDVSAPGRWWWRFHAAGWLMVAAFGAGMAVATLVWVVSS